MLSGFWQEGLVHQKPAKPFDVKWDQICMKNETGERIFNNLTCIWWIYTMANIYKKKVDSTATDKITNLRENKMSIAKNK